MLEKLNYHLIEANDHFGLLKGPYERKQHPNEQKGLDLYVDLINFGTGQTCRVKLYENKSGLHFKMNGTHYLSSFTRKVFCVPFQIIEED